MPDRIAAERMVEAARDWVASLDDAQRADGVVPWPAEAERHRWYYTPTDHGGLPLARMGAAQQQRAMRLVSTGLSHAGYVTAATIIGLENVLDQADGWARGWERERNRDPQLYWLTVFGSPSMTGAWSWRFGGHHVSIHHLVVDGRLESSTPSFLGADPATSPLLGGRLLRPLGAAEDLARDLVRSLDADQRARAVISPIAPVDIVSGNRPHVHDGDRLMPLPEVWRGRLADPRFRELITATHDRAEARAGFGPDDHDVLALTTTPKGIPAGDLSASQQDGLRALLDVFIGRVPAELAEREAAKIAGDRLHDVHFAWAGGVDPGEPHYYRLQGPRLLAEYDNTQRDVNHVHTVYRDPDGDFGDDVLRRHLDAFHR